MNPVDPHTQDFLNRVIEQVLKEKVEEISKRAAEVAASQVQREVMAASVEIAKKVQSRLITRMHMASNAVTVEIRLVMGGGQ